MTNSNHFGHLRSLLHRTPRKTDFHKILTTLFDAPEEEEEVWLEYARVHLSRQWPSHTKTIYANWWIDELRDVEDIPVRRLLFRYKDTLAPLWQMGSELNTGDVLLVHLNNILEIVKDTIKTVIVHSPDVREHTISTMLDQLSDLQHLHIHTKAHDASHMEEIIQMLAEHTRVPQYTLGLHGKSRYTVTSAPDLELLAKNPNLGQCRNLHLTGLGLGKSHLMALMQPTDAWPHLKLLDLSNNRLGDRAMPWLLTNPALGQLDTLILLDNSFGAEAKRHLRQRYPNSLVVE